MDTTSQSAQLITAYIRALDGQPKPVELIDRFVRDPALRLHILQAESAFPAYKFKIHHMVAQHDIVAVHATFQGVHKGPFAGVDPTGKDVSADLMIFYKIDADHIVDHWMQLDTASLMAQLTDQAVAAAHT